MFWVLIEAVLLSTHSRNKKNNFQIQTLIWRLAEALKFGYPPLSMAIKICNVKKVYFGRSSSSKKPSLVIACSPPGIVGRTGRPPVAMRICFAFIVSPFTSTVLLSMNWAWPMIFSTLDWKIIESKLQVGYPGWVL